ncbi:MAG: hypothetical protein ACQESF_06855 [Nanobdellota archaeon]
MAETNEQKTNEQNKSGVGAMQSSTEKKKLDENTSKTQEKGESEKSNPEAGICPQIKSCKFLIANKDNEDIKMAIQGFMKKYCNSNFKQCKIYKLGEKIGHEKIPENLMPNGLPITNTSDDQWSEKVKEELKSL